MINRASYMFTILVWACVISLHATFAYSASINVSLGFVAPLDDSYGPLKPLGQEMEAAFKIAIMKVNTMKDSPVKFRTDFKDLIKDEGKNPSTECGAIARQFHGDSNVVGVVGAYSSECSIAIQKEFVTSKSRMPQISYRSQSMKLLDKTQFPTFFRTCSNIKKEAQALVEVIKHFRWTQAGMIHSSDEYYGKELSDEIVSKSKNSGIYIKERVSFDSTASVVVIDKKLQAIKTSGSRVNIIVAQGNDFVRIVKQIKAKRMYGEGWVWIATDGGTSLNMDDDVDLNTTTAGFIGISPEMYRGSTLVDILISWYGTADTKAYPGRVWKENGQPSISPYVAQVFRAVAAYHSVLTDLAIEKKLTLKTSASSIRDLITQRLKATKDELSSVKTFLGGPIFFQQGTEGQAKFTVVNQVKSQFEQVGTWNELGNPALNLLIDKISWPGGSSQIPTDKGKPGKALFRIGFVSPIHPSLDVLGEYGKELLSAFRVALDIINKDDYYQVELDGFTKDEGFDGDKSCKEIAEEMKEQNLVAVVGTYRSQCSMRLHEVLGTEGVKMPIVSYASPSVALSDKKKFKYFFRVPPSNYYQSEIMKLVVRKFGFKQVATLYSDEISSREIAERFEAQMRNDTVPIVTSQMFPKSSNSLKLAEYVEKIRLSGARVIFLSALPNDVAKIEQIIHQKKMAGKGWIWLGSDGATSNYFTPNSELAKHMAGMLGVNPRRGEGALYLKLLAKWMSKDRLTYPGIIHNENTEQSLPYTAQVFDAVNGIALALSDLISRKTVSHRSNALTVRAHLFNKLESYNSESNGYISALGTNKRMYFDSNKDGPALLDIVNLVPNPQRWQRVAEFTVLVQGSGKEVLNYLKNPIFPGGHIVPVIGAGKVVYKIAAFFPKDDRLGALSDLGKYWESALRAAVSWVNKNDSLTVGFDVTYIDTGLFASNCSALSKKLPSVIDIVIGAARSECTARIYEQLRERGIPVITYASTSTLLSKKSNYPNLFRLCASDEHQAAALADLVEKYNWDRAGMVAAQGIYGEELMADVTELLGVATIGVTTSQLFERGSKRMTKQISMIKDSGSGVNLMIANPQDALQLFQEAFELGMTGQGWTWIGSDGAVSTMFSRSQNLQRAMEGMIGFRPKSGRGPLFESLYDEWLRVDHAADRQVAYIAQVFDSVLVPAFALHQLHKDKTITASVSKIDARTSLLRKMKSMRSLGNGFASTTGNQMHFNKFQDVPAKYELVNLNGNSWVPVGSYEDNQLHLTSSVVWPGGTVKFPPSNPPIDPSSETVKETSSSGTSQGLIVLAVVFSVFGLLVIIFMLYIVRRVRYRHLYMQSDLNQGGVFSVLYGHTVNRPAGTAARPMMGPPGNGHIKRHSLEAAVEMTDPMMPRHL